MGGGGRATLSNDLLGSTLEDVSEKTYLFDFLPNDIFKHLHSLSQEVPRKSGGVMQSLREV